MGKRLQRLLLERDKLLQAYYADAVPLDQFKKEQKRIAEETAELEAQLEAQRVPLAEARETLDLALKLAERLDKTYEQASEPARTQLNEAILQRIIVENKHIPNYELARPFQTLLVDRFPKSHIMWRWRDSSRKRLSLLRQVVKLAEHLGRAMIEEAQLNNSHTERKLDSAA